MATQVAAPRRIDSQLLVVESFKDSTGTEWRSGDHAPLHLSAVRQAAKERPHLFRHELETVPVDLELLDELERRYEERYQAAKHERDEEEPRRQRALREELEAQSRPSSSQKQLERRYQKQEDERVKQEKATRANVARQQLEAELETRHAAADLAAGFHFNTGGTR